MQLNPSSLLLLSAVMCFLAACSSANHPHGVVRSNAAPVGTFGSIKQIPLRDVCRLRGGKRSVQSKRTKRDMSSSSSDSEEMETSYESESSSEEYSERHRKHSRPHPKRTIDKHRLSSSHQRKPKKAVEDSRSDTDDESYSSDYRSLSEMNDSGDVTESSDDVQSRVDSSKLLNWKDVAEEKRDVAGEKRELAEAPSGQRINLSSKYVAEDVLIGLQALRQNRSNCDLVIAASDGQTEFHAHRAVLSALSPEFKAMTDRQQPRIILDGVSAPTLQSALDFIYTGRISVSEEAVAGLLQFSEKFSVGTLRQGCTEHFLKQLTVDNALRFRALGQAINSTVVFEAAHNVVMDDFQAVSLTPGFLELDAATLRSILESDDLAVDSEREVFDALARWVGHDETSRRGDLPALVGAVRMGLLTLDTLAKRVAPHGLVQKYLAHDPAFQATLNGAVAYVGSAGEARKGLEGPHTRLRAGSRGRYLMCIGGRKGSSAQALDRVWMLDRVHYDWYELEPLATPRKQLAAAELHGRLYVCGGWDGEQYLRGVEYYEPGPKAWAPSAMMQAARGSFGLAAWRGALWACGGYDGVRHLASVERFNASAMVWVPAAPLAVARSGLRVAAVEAPGFAGLVAMGGFDGHAVVGLVERYEEATGSWRPCAPLKQPRRDFAVAVAGDYIYAAGGFNGTHDLSSVERYDVNKNEWSDVADMTVARSGFGMATLNGRLHALGGYDGNAYLASAEFYDDKANVWMQYPEASLPLRMAHFAVAMV